MLSPELGVGHATARVHHATRRSSSRVAARSARAAAGDAGDWISVRWVSCGTCGGVGQRTNGREPGQRNRVVAERA